MDAIEKQARFRARVRSADPDALKQVADAWNGSTVTEAAKALKVTPQTLRDWKRRLPELRKLLEVVR